MGGRTTGKVRRGKPGKAQGAGSRGAARWKVAIRGASVFALWLLGAWLVVAFAETEKEIRVLCSMLVPGTTEAGMTRILDTGNFLRYRWVDPGEAGGGSNTGKAGSAADTHQGAGDLRVLVVRSPWNLGLSRCRVHLDDGTAGVSTFREDLRLRRFAGGAAAAGVFLWAVLHLLLGFGVPWGRGSRGGRHGGLPVPLRVLRLAWAGLLLLGSLALLQRAGATGLLPWPGVVEVLPLLLALLLALGMPGRFLSSRPWVRWAGTPFLLILSLLCLGAGLAD